MQITQQSEVGPSKFGHLPIFVGRRRALQIIGGRKRVGRCPKPVDLQIQLTHTRIEAVAWRLFSAGVGESQLTDGICRKPA